MQELCSIGMKYQKAYDPSQHHSLCKEASHASLTDYYSVFFAVVDGDGGAFCVSSAIVTSSQSAMRTSEDPL